MAQENDGVLLARIGVDAEAWAAEFCRSNPGHTDVDTMLVWFANAIGAGISEGQSREARTGDTRRGLVAAGVLPPVSEMTDDDDKENTSHG